MDVLQLVAATCGSSEFLLNLYFTSVLLSVEAELLSLKTVQWLHVGAKVKACKWRCTVGPSGIMGNVTSAPTRAMSWRHW